MREGWKNHVLYYFTVSGLADGSGERVVVDVHRHRSRPHRIDIMTIHIPHDHYQGLLDVLSDQTSARFGTSQKAYIYHTRKVYWELQRYAVTNCHLLKGMEDDPVGLK